MSIVTPQRLARANFPVLFLFISRLWLLFLVTRQGSGSGHIVRPRELLLDSRRSGDEKPTSERARSIRKYREEEEKGNNLAFVLNERGSRSPRENKYFLVRYRKNATFLQLASRR